MPDLTQQQDGSDPISTAEQIRNNLNFSLDASPDREAELRRLSVATSTPIESVRAQPDAVKQLAAQQSFDAVGVAIHHPELGRFLTGLDNTRLIHDDIPATAAVESATRAVARAPVAPRSAIDMLMPGGQPQAAQPAAPTGPTFSAWNPSYGQRLRLWLNDVFGLNARENARAWIARAASQEGMTPDQARQAVGGMSEIPMQAASKFENMASFGIVPDMAGPSQTGWGGVAGGVGSLAGFIAGGPIKATEYLAGKLGSNALTHVAGESFAKALARDVAAQGLKLGTAGTLSQAGNLIDAPDAATAGISTAKTFGQNAGMGAVFGAAGRMFPDNTLMQGAARVLGVNAALDAMNGTNPLDDRPIEQKVFDYGLNTLFSLRGAGRVTGGWFHDAARAELAGQDAANLDALSTAAASSKLRERAPDLFKEFVRASADGGDTPDVWVDGKALAEGLQQSRITPDEVRQKMPDVATQMNEALQTDGLVRIPVEDYATHIAGSPLDEALRQDMRLSPQGMTIREANDWNAKQVEALKSEAEARDAASQNDAAQQASRDAVRDAIKAQIESTGRYAPEVAARYADLATAHYAIRAEQLGITPEEMFARRPLKVQAESLLGPQLNQDRGGDPSGEEGPFGPVLTEYKGDAQGAIAKLMEMKSGEAIGALHHPDIGDIDLVWGEEGTNAHDGYGLSKLVRWHPDVLGDLQGIVSSMKVVKRSENRAMLESADHKGGVRLQWDGVRKTWLLTAFRKDGAKGGGVPRTDTNTETQVDGSLPAHPSDDSVAQRIDKFYQEGNGPLGTYDPPTNTITLLKDADRSTFLHELGHAFLSMHMDLAGELSKKGDLTDGERQIVGDAGTLLKWFKVSDLDTWNKMSLDEQREAHENFARGFEQYLFEGKAPSIGLQRLFRTFRAWLVHLYRTAPAFRVDLSDDVRGVMNRMVASENEIRDAESVRGMKPLFEVKPEGMTDEAYANYQRIGADATADAIDNLESRSLRNTQWLSNAKGKAMRELQGQARDARARIRDEVLDEVSQSPVWQAKEAVERARNPNQAFDDDLKAWRGKRDSEMKNIPERWKKDNPAPDNSAEVANWEAQKKAVKAKDRKAWQAENPRPDNREAVKAWRERRDAEVDQLKADWLKDNPQPEKPRSAVDDWSAARTAAADKFRDEEKARATDGLSGIKKGQALAKAKREIDNAVERRVLEWERDHPKPTQDRPVVDMDLLAEQYGFINANEMNAAIKQAGSKGDYIKATIDQRMLERHGDLVDPDSIERAAEAAIHNEARARFIATELSALAKATGPTKALTDAAREAAEDAIAAKRVRDLSPSQYTMAEARSARAADKAFKAGDMAEAGRMKRAQLLNNQLTRAAQSAIDEVEKGLTYFKRFDKASGSISLEYREQIDALLERYDLRKSVSGAALDKRQSLLDWVESQQEAGYEPAVPDALLDEAKRQHYKDMSVEDFRGLVDAVKSIEHLGRLKQRLIDGQEARAFGAVVDEAVASMGALPQKDPQSNRGLSRIQVKLQGAKNLLQGMDASLLKMEQMLDWLDDHNPLGPMNRVVFRRIADAGVKENDLRSEVVGKLRELAKAMPAEVSRQLDNKITLPELIDSQTGKPQVLLKRELLALALNVGNDSNFAKLCAGEKWHPDAVWRALDAHMTKPDLDFVQGIWDAVNSLWPEIEAMERRLGNTAPDKVQPRAFQTRHGEYRGGYYPMVYDPQRSFDVEQRRARSGDALFENTYQRATTPKGHTKDRTETYARPVLLSLDVLPRHINQVIHDIAYREAIIDADRFLSDSRVRGGIEGALGREYYQQLKPWLQSIANDRVYDAKGLSFWDKAAHWARTTATMVGLGYRVTTMLIHGSTAASNSVGEIGAGWMASGIRDTLGTPAKIRASYDFITARSGEVRHRMNEVDRDVRDALREMETRHAEGPVGMAREVLDGARRFAYYGIAMLDFASVIPTWKGAYNKALTPVEKGGLGLGEQDAIYFADKAIRNAHGGTGAKDLSAIQRGNEFQKLFSMFYSFWGHFYNRQRDIGRSAVGVWRSVKGGDYAGARRDFAQVLARSWFYFVIPQLLHAALKPSKDEEGEHNWALWAAEEIGLGMFSGIPVVRDVANSAFTGRDYTATPAVSIVESAFKSKRPVTTLCPADQEFANL